MGSTVLLTPAKLLNICVGSIKIYFHGKLNRQYIYIEWTRNQLLNDKKHSDDSNKLVFNAIKCSKYLFIVNNYHNYQHKLWLMAKIK